MANTPGYYANKLSADRLRRCYDIAPPRVRQYLHAETQHVLSNTRPTDRVLELGCGYGRAIKEFVPDAGCVVGFDASAANIALARNHLAGWHNVHLFVADAAAPALADTTFDVVACIQNGLSAFKVDRRALVAQCLRMTKPGGLVLLSTYAERFWPDRLNWFERQAREGLIGEIDRNRTGNGTIICKDGFTATTITPGDFENLCASLNVAFELEEVDESSLFCEIRVAR